MLLAFGVFSCSPSISKVSKGTAEDAMKSMKFYKDPKTGECFGMFSTGKATSSEDSAISLTWVPCDKVEKFLEK
jgi:hypothetical protein